MCIGLWWSNVYYFMVIECVLLYDDWMCIALWRLNVYYFITIECVLLYDDWMCIILWWLNVYYFMMIQCVLVCILFMDAVLKKKWNWFPISPTVFCLKVQLWSGRNKDYTCRQNVKPWKVWMKVKYIILVTHRVSCSFSNLHKGIYWRVF